MLYMLGSCGRSVGRNRLGNPIALTKAATITWKSYYSEIGESSGNKNSKYYFNEPPLTDGAGQKQGQKVDPKHFFTKPQLDDMKSYKITKTSNGRFIGESGGLDESSAMLIGEAIAKQRRKRRNQISSAIFCGIFGTLGGYFIIYKLFYLNEESFIPMYPASKVRKLSNADMRKIDLPHIQTLSQIRVLSVLSRHEMIKDEYGVPIHGQDSNLPPDIEEFSVWCEDQDPCVTGLVLRRDDPEKLSTHIWHRIPHVVQWRVTHRPICISKVLGSIFYNAGINHSTLYDIAAPEKMYDSFKYEYPLPGDEHSMHLWFLGEMRIAKDTLIIFKGKFHVDVNLMQIDLLRREEGKLVRYVLFKNDENDER